MKISLCIITHNEAEQISKTVELLKSCKLIDEVVIVDQDSNIDNSKILEEISNVYVKTTRKGNADFDRNFGISLVSGEYVLCLDSDEFIKQTEIEKIKKALEIDGDVYWFKFENIVTYNGKEFDLKPLLGDDPHPRLHRKFIKLQDGKMAPTLVYDNMVFHKYPMINTMKQVFTDIYITHYRTVESIIKTHIIRFNLGDENSRAVEKRFLNDLFKLISFTDYSKYPELRRILK